MSNNLEFIPRSHNAALNAKQAGVDEQHCDAILKQSHMFLMDNQLIFSPDNNQESEKLIIDDFFKYYVGNFLVIGAANGIDQSRGLLERGWNVVYCEPDPVACGHLLKTTDKWKKQVTIINSAVTPGTDGLIKFFVSELTGLSGVAPSAYENREILTNAVSINNLFNTIGYNFDYIQIDAEGLDNDLVKAMNWSLIPQCKMLCIEAGWSSWNHLLNYGYVLTDFIAPYGVNTIYRQFSVIDSNRNLKMKNE